MTPPEDYKIPSPKDNLNKLRASQSLPTVNVEDIEAPGVTHSDNPIKIRKSILIIEDNSEMRHYLKSILNQQYECLTAENGKQGITIAQEKFPDIIVCDVMMPILDGFGVVEGIRDDITTSHIPILLLSAKNDRESKLHGLNLLADDYLTKPFDEIELLARVSNLLNIRTLVKQSLGQQITKPENSLIEYGDALSEKDSLFVQNLSKVIQENFTQIEFSTKNLAHSLHMGVRSLQVKMKALFDLTPMDYLRMYRLQQAKQLLANTDAPIGLIAEQVGFNSQSYFSRCFKAIYHLSPKQFRQELERN